MSTRTLVVVFSMLACSPSSSSTDAGADAPAVSFTYAPAGCGYTVSVGSRGFVSPSLDDASPIIDAVNGAPQRVRLGLGGTTRGADATTTTTFTWETAAALTAARVRMGTQPTALSDEHAGYSWITPPPAIGFGKDEPAANMHEVHVCGLQPATTYYYQVGGGAPGQEAWSATQSFTTLPTSGPITIGVSGDSRDDASVFQLSQERMRDASVAMQLFSGDFILWGTQESLYQQWLDAAQSATLGQQLILPVAGNHENSSAQFYGNFSLPGDGPYAESFFSFDVGSAHVLQFDDQAIAVAPTSDEAVAALAFIESDLATAEQNRAARPFIIVQHHRGDFSTGTYGSDSDVIATRQLVVPIFAKHHVDLVLTGHDHEYERTNPLTGDPMAPTVTTPDQGVTYVVSGGAGADASAIGTAPSATRAIAVAFGSSTPYVGTYALMTLDAHALTFKAYGLKASGSDDPIDAFTLTR